MLCKRCPQGPKGQLICIGFYKFGRDRLGGDGAGLCQPHALELIDQCKREGGVGILIDKGAALRLAKVLKGNVAHQRCGGQ